MGTFPRVELLFRQAKEIFRRPDSGLLWSEINFRRLEVLSRRLEVVFRHLEVIFRRLEVVFRHLNDGFRPVCGYCTKFQQISGSGRNLRGGSANLW
jgi:hypothetical protein